MTLCRLTTPSTRTRKSYAALHFCTPVMANVMPTHMKIIEWIEPWEAVEQPAESLNAELKKEVPPEHPLYGRSANAIGHRIDCDDVLFELSNGTLAVVHLTWSGKQDQHPQFPWTTQFQSIDEFIENAMIPDAKEYGSLA